MLWPIAVGLTLVGLLPTMVAPVLGDDLVVITDGFAARTSGESTLDYALDYADQMIAGGHVLPVGGFLSALQVSVVEVLSRTGLSVSLSWGLARGVLIVSSLVTLAFTLGYWIDRVSQRPGSPRIIQHALAVYLLASAVLIGTLQIHGAWSQDPVLSYALASWATPLLGFVFFTVASAILFGGRAIVLGPPLLVLGLVGVLLYEPFVIAIGASVASQLVYLLVSRPEKRELLQFVKVTLIAALAIAFFLLAQIWRISQPSDYAGTQPGFADLIVPTWATSFLSSVPFTSIPLALEQTSPVKTFPALLAVPAIAAVALAVIAMLMLRKGSYQEVSLRSLSPPVVFLVLLWAGTSLIFATSSKYQMEIGTQLGRTYLFYATGSLAFSGMTALLILLLRSRSRLVLPGFLVGVTLASGIQWTVNAQTLNSIEDMYGWTRSAANSLADLAPLDERCVIVRRLQQGDIPDFYRSGVLSGLEVTYQERFKAEYC